MVILAYTRNLEPLCWGLALTLTQAWRNELHHLVEGGGYKPMLEQVTENRRRKLAGEGGRIRHGEGRLVSGLV